SVSALASSGYRMIEANHGEEALHAARQHSGPIHLLVTDVIMPKMGGVELSRRFRELRPGAGVLYITGYAGDALAEVPPDVDVLKKPFTNDALLHRVREVLDRLSGSDASRKNAATKQAVRSAEATHPLHRAANVLLRAAKLKGPWCD